MSDWRKERIALIANGLHINRDELERLIGQPASAHLVRHATGDVTAMVPFNRAKLTSDEPATRLADMSDVARAQRAARDYTDDGDAVAMRHVDRQVGDLAKRVNDVTNRVAALEKREPSTAVTWASYFAPVYDNGRFRSVDDASALVVENVKRRAECDELRRDVKQQARTISEVTLECLNLRKENAALREERGELQDRIDGQAATIGNLEREREHIREGREKAVARCMELEEANKHLYALLGANL